MWHNHTHNWCNHTHAWSNIRLAFFLNLTFTLIEFVWWFLTNSVAIMADAVHDLGDSISLWLAWKLERVSTRGRTKKYSYGYKRFSILAAFINSLILIIGSIYVLNEAIPRLINPEASDYLWMFFLAILGVLINAYGAYKVIKGSSFNERVISWHLLEDVLWWVWVLIISIVNFFIEFPLLDPLLAIIFTLFILWNIIKNLKELIKIFLQSVPSHINIKEIETEIKKLQWVINIHDIHVWTMDGEDAIFTCHIILDNILTLEESITLKRKIREYLKEKKVEHSTIEFDIQTDKCEYIDC